MLPDISALSQYQIRRFFQKNTSVTQESCNAEAERITGQPVTSTLCQGATSYTVEGGQNVVQFRVPSSTLDMDLLKSIEQAYRGFTPRHEHRGKFGEVQVYTMNNVGGICAYLARNHLQSNNYHLLRVTLDDFARFFASAYHNTPAEMERPDRAQLYDKHLSQLQQLRQELPQRFHPALDDLIPQLPALFTKEWPLVPNHTDLLENNIHVDTTTGRIAGICDWRGAEVGPFGMSVGGAEIMLGTLVTNADFWRYHPNHEELRDHFRERLHHYMAGPSDAEKGLVEAARLLGLFLANGFRNGKPATEEDEDLGFLGAVLRYSTRPSTHMSPL